MTGTHSYPNYTFFIAASWGDSAISLHFRALAAKLVERGHQVVYLPHGKELRIDDGLFQAYSFPSPRPTRLRDFIFLHGLVRKYRPDCMIANFGASNVMTIVGWINRVPCRVDWYHTLSSQIQIDSQFSEWRTSVLNLRKRMVLHLSTAIIANTSATRDDAVSTYGVKASMCHVLNYSIEDPGLNVTPPAENILMCAGRLHKSKGQDTVLRALSELHQKGIMPGVRFIGDGAERQHLGSLAAELRVADQVEFVGRAPHDTVLTEMARGAVVLTPSRSEAFGLVNIEAMAVGTPVIASNVGGIPEIIRDSIDGFLVPPDDPHALAEKIAILLLDKNLRDEMGRNARQRFLDKFELTRNVELQADWFEEMVHTRRVGAG